MILPIIFLVSLFRDSVNVYEVHNSGGWYNFGFLLGTWAAYSQNAPTQTLLIGQWLPMSSFDKSQTRKRRKRTTTAKKMTTATKKTTATRSRELGQSKATLGDHAFNFQYPFNVALWTFCSCSSRFRAVTTASGRFRSCSAKSRSLTITSPVGYRW